MPFKVTQKGMLKRWLPQFFQIVNLKRLLKESAMFLKSLASSFAAAITLAVVTTPASAVPVNITFNAPLESGIRSGPFDIDVAAVNAADSGLPGVGLGFVAWCIDLGQSIRLNQTFSGYELGDRTVTNGTNMGPQITWGMEQALSRLFTFADGDDGTLDGTIITASTAENDAIQLAIWQIIYGETASIIADSLYDSARAAADLLRANSATTAANYGFAFYASPTNQNQTVGFFLGDGVNNTPQIPLPAGALLLLGGLGATMLTRRRRKSA